MEKRALGDFQTPEALARQVVQLLSQQEIHPDLIVEPTCGSGNFLSAAYEWWGDRPQYVGFEFNEDHCATALRRFSNVEAITIQHQDFFSFNWERFFNQHIGKNLLIIGNPPWVTNSLLGRLGAANVPAKSNHPGYRGFDAKTGKSNFDIAESIILSLLEACVGFDGRLLFLCKTSTARRVLSYLWKSRIGANEPKVYLVDAKKHFGVATTACLLSIELSGKMADQSAPVYSSLSNDKTALYRFGIRNGALVANLDDHIAYEYLDGYSNYVWRSGIKHDASKVMELTPINGKLVNGFGEVAEIEDDLVYPLLKSSDLGNGRRKPRKYVIITQKTMGEDTNQIAYRAPKTWEYLCDHADILNNRKSSIYKDRPQFSLFGVGPYSFSDWKVALSGLYTNSRFVMVAPFNRKPTMVDDTCYFIPCASQNEAVYWTECLNSERCRRFLQSLIFADAKRPITTGLLNRINLAELSHRHDGSAIAHKYLEEAGERGRGNAKFVF